MDSMRNNATSHYIGVIRTQYGLLTFDVRPYTHFAKAHVKDALNLCIPTTLLKRPSAADDRDKGRNVSEKFLELEKNELERMKQALSYEKSADASLVGASGKFRVAGIEKGSKNRYNDIYPFDHSRVKLQDVSPNGCDYVNASFLKAEYSDKRYIATQAPVPDTFTK
ncbi:hypothetical protein ATERTT37_004197 [Aspergillus terreus]